MVIDRKAKCAFTDATIVFQSLMHTQIKKINEVELLSLCGLRLSSPLLYHTLIKVNRECTISNRIACVRMLLPLVFDCVAVCDISNMCLNQKRYQPTSWTREGTSMNCKLNVSIENAHAHEGRLIYYQKFCPLHFSLHT